MRDSPPLALLLDGEGGARRLTEEGLRDWRPAQGPLWVDLDEASPGDRRWLERTLASLGATPFRAAWPKLTLYEPEHLFLLMHLQAPDGAVDAFAVLRVWLEPGRIVTLRSRPLPPFEELHRGLEEARGATDASELLLLLVEGLGDQVFDDVLELRTAVSELDLSLEERAPVSTRALRRLRRRIVHLERFVDPQRSLLLRLESLELPWFTGKRRHRWETAVATFSSGSAELDAIDERARTIQESLAHQTSDEINRRIYFLTVFASIFVPLSLIASIFGANISTVHGNILDADHPLWFWIFLLGNAFVGLLLFWLFRRGRFF